VAQAAAHAHEAGVIHRDIKPGNVLLSPADVRDEGASAIPMEPATDGSPSTPAMTVKLGDFGLGRQSEPDDGDDPLTQLTTDGSRLGTPAWMAPEQIDRSFGAVGPATDVHAIGLLLDRMLTGRPLRGGKTDIEIYREVLLDDPVAADRVVRGVPADLAAVCLKCLARQPGDRYASAAALADDLGLWLAGLPTHARPLTPLQRIGGSVARRPMSAALATAAVLSLCLAGWAALERSREARKSVVHQDELRRQNAAAELRRGFESLRAANVAGAIEQMEKTRAIDPGLADSLAARWLERRLHGEREIVLRPATTPGVRSKRPDLYCLAMSPDGGTIVAGGADGVLRVIRNGAGNTDVVEVQAHDEINDVCISSDGRLIASVGQDGRLRWWASDHPDAVAGEAPPAGCPLYGVAFSQDDSAIYYGGEDCVLRRVDVEGATPPRDVHTLPPVAGESPEIEAIVPAGRLLVVASGGSLVAFRHADGSVAWAWNRGPDDPRRPVFHALAASPDGTRVAGGGTDRDVSVWNTESGTLVATLPPHPHWVQACRFSSDGSLLATACRDGVVRVFRTTDWKPVAKLIGHVGRVWDVCFEATNEILSSAADGTLRRWGQPSNEENSPFRDIPVPGTLLKSVRDATTNSSQCRVLAVSMGARPLLVSVLSGSAVELSVGVRLPNEGVSVDRVRGRVAFGFSGAAVGDVPLVMNLDSAGRERQPGPLPSRSDRVGPAVCWTSDGGLVTNSSDGHTYVWPPLLDRAIDLGQHGVGGHRVEIAPQAPPRVAIAAHPGRIRRLDAEDPLEPREVLLEEVGDPVSAIAWAPDGRHLTCGFRNGPLHVFDARTGRRSGTLAPHERRVVDVAYSPDGRAVLSADAECVRISDTTTLTTLDELRPGWQIESMCLAGGGRFVVIAGHALQPSFDGKGQLAVLDLDVR
jgi:WD40 repeat protein